MNAKLHDALAQLRKLEQVFRDAAEETEVRVFIDAGCAEETKAVADQIEAVIGVRSYENPISNSLELAVKIPEC